MFFFYNKTIHLGISILRSSFVSEFLIIKPYSYFVIIINSCLLAGIHKNKLDRFYINKLLIFIELSKSVNHYLYTCE
ncbi:hypothetical protein ZONE111904_14805 [Zobellia nedashkovskayae]